MKTSTKPHVLSASTMIGDEVSNMQGEKIGKIEEIMLDIDEGRVSYAVLSFGGFMGMGNKLFAIPWKKLQLDMHDKKFRLDVAKEVLKKADGFDKDNWPEATEDWLSRTYDYYDAKPYWQ